MKKVTSTTGRASDKFMLRLPDGMRDAIADMAKNNGRSMNAEIVHRLQRSLDDDAEFADGDGIRYIEGLRIVPRESQAMKHMADRDDPLKMVESLLLDVRDLLRGKDKDK